MFKQKKAALTKLGLFAGLIVFGVLILLIQNGSTGKKSSGQPNQKPLRGLESAAYKQEYKYWNEQIDKVGAEAAYKGFKEKYSSSPYGSQHSLAHVLGELLYDKLGVKGVSICDDSFSFGCYHSFFGKAVSKEGLKVTKEFDQACKDKYGQKNLPCQHGIGHGLLSYFGNEKLVNALNECTKITWQSLGGCSSGVFMEYNFQTMADPTKASVRVLTKEGPHYPCKKVPSKFTPVCYFEQVQWWESTFSNDYKKIGSLCAEVQDMQSKEACFHGAGNYAAPSVNYDVGKTTNLCNQMPTLVGKADCIEGASWILLARPNGSQDALTLCDALQDEFRNNCILKVKQNPFFR